MPHTVMVKPIVEAALRSGATNVGNQLLNVTREINQPSDLRFGKRYQRPEERYHDEWPRNADDGNGSREGNPSTGSEIVNFRVIHVQKGEARPAEEE